MPEATPLPNQIKMPGGEIRLLQVSQVIPMYNQDWEPLQ